MKRLLIFMIMIIAYSQLSCNDDNSGIACTTPNSTQISIKYYTKHAQGLNLIEQFPRKGIKVYYKEDGVFKMTTNSAKALIAYDQNDDENTVTITLETSNLYKNNFSEMLLELNESQSDTVKCEYDIFEGNKNCSPYVAFTNVWYNGELSEASQYNILLFEIEK